MSDISDIILKLLKIISKISKAKVDDLISDYWFSPFSKAKKKSYWFTPNYVPFFSSIFFLLYLFIHSITIALYL